MKNLDIKLMKKLKDIIYFENKLKLSDEKTYKNFIRDINKSKNKLYKFLLKQKKIGKKIHGYGASTKGNVLLQYYKINNKMVDYMQREIKINTIFTRLELNIKIISEVLSRFYKPDYYLVLPWHFKEEILIREKKLEEKELDLSFLFRN